MITVKEYAELKGVSHQAVYKQIQAHSDELKGCIVKQGRTRFLTDDAVAILDQYRETSPQIIEKSNDKERIEALENNIKKILSEKSELETKLREVLEWKADKAVEIAEVNQNKKLLEDKTTQLQEKEKLYLEAKKEADQLHLQNQQLQKQLEAERNKKWYQKIFKKQ